MNKINNIDKNDYLRRKEALTSFFLNKEYKLMTKNQIIKFFSVPKEDYNIFDEIIDELQNDGIIFEDDSKRYVAVKTSNILKCVYEAKSEKFGFGLVENGEDIYISSRNSNGAMDKDEILVQKIEGNHKTEGQVVKVLKRNTKKVIGVFNKNNNFGFVVPINKKIEDVYIPKKQTIGYKNGVVVEAQITKYATTTSKAEGKIIRVIAGKRDDKSELKSLGISYGLDLMQDFSFDIKQELKNIPSKVNDDDITDRVDRTNERVFTIDASDAMDLDDAVQVKKQGDNYLLSVYIADVSHYVKDGSNLDKEAIYRGTSIYIPGTVIPMLPKKLSNGICSLNQGLKRLTLAIDILFDKKGNVIESNVFKSIIRVTKKMSYDNVYKVIIGENVKGYMEYKDDIMQMKELAIL